jgi:basic membrane protein A
VLRARNLSMIAGVATAALVLGACGSSSTATGASSAATSATSAAASAAAGSGATSGAMSSGAMTGGAMTSGAMTSGAMSSGAMTGGAASSGAMTGGAATSGAMTSAVASSSGAATSGSGTAITGDPSKVKFGLAYDLGGRGDQSFNDAAAAGLDKAKAAGVGVAGELEATNGEPDSAKVDRLNQLIDDGATDIVAVGFAYAGPLGTVAKANPDVHFAIIDDYTPGTDTGDNIANLTFAEEQGSYLVGVAAALKSKTKHVGFIGGVNTPLIAKFQAGFDAGAKATTASIKIDNKYITEPPDFGGFNAPDKGQTIAKGMFDGGADVVYAAAGGSGAGVFKAAKAAGRLGIGVDSDQYNLPSLADVKSVILTSMVKRVDVAVFDFIASAVNGKPLSGQHIYDLKVGGVDFSTSGGQVDDIKAKLDAAKADIISGKIKVPTKVG